MRHAQNSDLLVLFFRQRQSIEYIQKTVLSKRHLWIRSCILFGSCARKTQRPLSDVDILFLTDQPNSQMLQDIRLLKSEFAALDEKEYAEIDAKFFSEEEFAKSGTTFINSVKKDGILL